MSWTITGNYRIWSAANTGIRQRQVPSGFFSTVFMLILPHTLHSSPWVMELLSLSSLAKQPFFSHILPYLDFTTLIFWQSKGISLVSNPQLRGPVPVLMSPCDRQGGPWLSGLWRRRCDQPAHSEQADCCLKAECSLLRVRAPCCSKCKVIVIAQRKMQQSPDYMTES